MTKYVQTNPQGYVTGIVEEPLLAGLFGGTKTMEIQDDQAESIEALLRACNSQGEGLHIDKIINSLNHKP
ncbi:MAG: hypothetical protein PHH54_04965 [Candidatus Nanoarchaeia archaeon]|nr:hypothetical protein [Candidatus Nanoarchaeia archaeon]MDD5741309.1 hypothetical protein [Candidatus Nanoarchaeia archaeon]